MIMHTWRALAGTSVLLLGAVWTGGAEEGERTVVVESAFIQTDDATFRLAAEESGVKLAKGLNELPALAQGLDDAAIEKFRILLGGLKGQGKGTELLAMPRIACRSGKNAVIKIIRRFEYPVGWNSSAEPTEFEETEIGPQIGVAPDLAGSEIQMSAAPRIIYFCGFKTNRLEAGTGANPADKPIWVPQPVFRHWESRFRYKGPSKGSWWIVRLEPEAGPVIVDTPPSPRSITGDLRTDLPAFLLICARESVPGP